MEKRHLINELPECGVEGCNEKGWIGLGNRFVCGDCVIRIRQIEIAEQFEKLKK